MKSEPLLNLVTCIEGMDEWRNVWGFDPKEIVAFIRKGTIVKVPSAQVSSLNQVNVQNHIENDDVWVINGRYVTHQGFQQWIQKIHWSNLGREVRIKVHRGGGRSIKDSDFQQTRRALGKFLEGAQDYSLGGQIDQNHPVVRFAQYINNGNPNDNWQNYDNELAQLRHFFLAPHIKLSILKHRINHILGPIDMDLQRIEEKAKANDYTTFCKELKDFRERYKDFDWEAAFKMIESEVDKFLKSQKKELKISQNLKNLFKENIKDFLNMVKNGEVEKVFKEINNRVSINPLSFWLRKLDENLDETIEGG